MIFLVTGVAHTIQKMARVPGTFCLLQAFRHGHLTGRGTGRCAEWSAGACSIYQTLPERYLSSEELHMIVWCCMAYSVHEATEHSLQHLKVAKT